MDVNISVFENGRKWSSEEIAEAGINTCAFQFKTANIEDGFLKELQKAIEAIEKRGFLMTDLHRIGLDIRIEIQSSIGDGTIDENLRKEMQLLINGNRT